MTTIAWDGRTMAADRMASIGSWMQYTVMTKLWKGKWFDGRDVLLGMCGDMAFNRAVMRALDDGKPVDQMPKYTDYDVEKGNTVGLLVDREGNVYTVTARLELLQFDEVILAVGSGREIAIGAMEAGAPAVRAIQIAGKRSPGSGLGVQQIRFDDPQDELDN